MGGSGTIFIAQGTYTSGATLGATQNGWDITIDRDGVGEVIIRPLTALIFYADSGFATGSIAINNITIRTGHTIGSYDTKAITSISTTGNLCTVDTTDPHGLSNGDIVHITPTSSGSDIIFYRIGEVTVVDPDTYTLYSDENGTQSSTVSYYETIYAIIINDRNVDVTLTDCIFGDDSDEQLSVLGLNTEARFSPTRDVSVTGCTFNNCETAVKGYHALSLEFKNNTVTTSSDSLHTIIWLSRRLGYTDISLNTFTGLNLGTTRDGYIVANPDHTSESWISNTDVSAPQVYKIYDNEITSVYGGIRLEYLYSSQTGYVAYYVYNNTIDISGGTTTNVIMLGTDNSETINRPDYIHIVGNTVNNNSSDPGHSVLAGLTVPSGEIAYNNIMGGNYGLVQKGSNFSVHHNVINSQRPLALKGASGNTIFNNTFVSPVDRDKYVIGIGNQPTGTLLNSTNNSIRDNIFVQYSTEDTNPIFGSDTDAVNGMTEAELAEWNLVERNSYYTDSGLFAKVKELTNPEDLVGMQAVWPVWGDAVFPDNDSLSIEEDPQFKDPANGDFTPTNPALKLDDGTWIGAVQPEEGPSSVFTGIHRSIYR
jgi:hypothetical protein